LKDYATMSPAELVAEANDLTVHSQHMSARAQALRQLATLRQHEAQLLTSLPHQSPPAAAAKAPIASHEAAIPAAGDAPTRSFMDEAFGVFNGLDQFIAEHLSS
jgi:hypothetical protein